jgi:hypothetical protein
MLLVVKLVKLRVVVFKNAFCLKFNTHAFTRFNICKVVVLKFIIAKNFTGFCKLIYYTSLRRLSR